MNSFSLFTTVSNLNSALNDLISFKKQSRQFYLDQLVGRKLSLIYVYRRAPTQIYVTSFKSASYECEVDIRIIQSDRDHHMIKTEANLAWDEIKLRTKYLECKYILYLQDTSSTLKLKDEEHEPNLGTRSLIKVDQVESSSSSEQFKLNAFSIHHLDQSLM